MLVQLAIRNAIFLAIITACFYMRLSSATELLVGAGEFSETYTVESRFYVILPVKDKRLSIGHSSSFRLTVCVLKTFNVSGV